MLFYHAVTHANQYCIMLALADSLAATPIGSNAHAPVRSFPIGQVTSDGAVQKTDGAL